MLNDLPTELTERILHYVDTSTRLTCVSRLSRLYQQTSNEPTSWKAISFTSTTNRSGKQSHSLCNEFHSYLLTYYLSRWKYITSLDLTSCNHITDQPMLYVWLHCHDLRSVKFDRCIGITDQTFAIMASSSRCKSKLESISVNQCDALTSQSFIDIGDACPSLTRLSFNDCDVDNRVLSTISNCLQLRSLSMNHCDINDMGLSQLAPLNQLINLSFNSCHRLTSSSLTHLLHMNELQTLDLSQWTVSDEDLQQFLPCMFQLKVLILHKCVALSNSTVQCICRSNVKLEHLDLALCSHLVDNAFESISQLDQLQTLILDRCTRLTDQSTLYMSKLSNLIRLSLSSCSAITDNGIEYVSSKCLNLRYLNIAGCYKITRARLRSLPDYIVVKI